MTSEVVEFGLVWIASMAHFIVVGMSSMSVICTRPCHSIDLSMLILESQRFSICHVGIDIV